MPESLEKQPITMVLSSNVTETTLTSASTLTSTSTATSISTSTATVAFAVAAVEAAVKAAVHTAEESTAGGPKKTNKYHYWVVGQTTGALIIFCMIVVGNLSILHRLKSCRRRRSNVNYFIIQLAVADLFVGFFSVTLDSILRLQKSFPYGLIACRASKYISVLFIYSSTFLLVALSIDRWEAVVRPLAFTKNRNHGFYLVIGAWMLALICATPVTVSTQIQEVDGLNQCWVNYSKTGWKIYMVYLTSSLLVVPAIIIAICYTHIVCTIWRRGQSVISQSGGGGGRNGQAKRKRSHRRRSSAFASSTTAITVSGDTVRATTSPFDDSEFDELEMTKTAAAAGALECNLSTDLKLDDSQDTEDEEDLPKDISISNTYQTEDHHHLHQQEQQQQQQRQTVGRQKSQGQVIAKCITDQQEKQNEDTFRLNANNDSSSDIVGISALGNQQKRHKYSDRKRQQKRPQQQQQQLGNATMTMMNITMTKKELNDRPNIEIEEVGEEGEEEGEEEDEDEEEDEKKWPQPIKVVGGAEGGAKAAALTARKRNKKFLGSRQHGNGVIPKARIKTIKMTLVIVVAFILCWLPFCIINLCGVFGLIKTDTDFAIALMTFTQSLAHLNSAVNPIIFWIFSSKQNRANSGISKGITNKSGSATTAAAAAAATAAAATTTLTNSSRAVSEVKKKSSIYRESNEQENNRNQIDDHSSRISFIRSRFCNFITHWFDYCCGYCCCCCCCCLCRRCTRNTNDDELDYEDRSSCNDESPPPTSGAQTIVGGVVLIPITSGHAGTSTTTTTNQVIGNQSSHNNLQDHHQYQISKIVIQ